MDGILVIGRKLMKWIGRITKEGKHDWHLWWAWHPVVIHVTQDQRKVYAWLQTVQRKGTYHYVVGYPPYWEYEYKEIEEQI